MLAKDSVDRNGSEAHGKYEAAEGYMQIGRLLFEVLQLFIHGLWHRYFLLAEMAVIGPFRA